MAVRRLFGLAAAIAVFSLVLSSRFNSIRFGAAYADEPRIRIGAILPLSGDAASWGEAIKNGIELARSSLPPELARRIDIFYEDDQRNANLSVTAFQKLTRVSKVIGVIGVTAQPGMAVAPLAEQARIPYISIAVPKKISDGKKYVVMYYALAERMGEVMAEEAVRRSYKRIARVSSIHDGRFAMKQEFDRAAAGRVQVVLDEEYPVGDKDFRPFLNKVRAEPGIDAIYVNLVLGQAGLAAKQARELGISLPLFESEMFEDEAEVELSQGALNGQWFVNEADPPQSFLDAYTKRFPKAKIFNAANGYDAFLLIANAAARSLSPDEINRFIHHPGDLQGSMGSYRITADNRFDLPVAIKEVQPSGFKTLSVFAPPAEKP